MNLIVEYGAQAVLLDSLGADLGVDPRRQWQLSADGTEAANGMQTDSQGRRALKLRSGRNAASAELGVILMARAATPVVSRPVLATLRKRVQREQSDARDVYA